jgi:hypothetical protein
LIKVLAATAMAFATILGHAPAGCEIRGRIVVGWVKEKRVEPGVVRHYIIIIDRRPFSVPRSFWDGVRVGDKVGFDEQGWAVVHRPGEPLRVVPVELVPAPAPTQTPGL